RIRALVLDRYEPPSGPLLFDSGAVWSIYDEAANGWRIECRSTMFGETPYKVATIARDLSAVDVNVRLVGDEATSPIEFPLDELLINALLTARGGVEIHSCGVIDRDGSGYLFAGNSGGGKTTTARLWQHEDVDIVSDDRVVLRKEEGEWWMYGTPWHGEAEICSPSRARLSRIFLLDKSTVNSERSLASGAAVARLLSCAFPPFHDAGGVESVLGILADLVAAVPASELSFVKDATAIAFVRGLVAEKSVA
ncbi:MAG: hypothetical protein ABI837_15175, partial [Acidobacteriota bacterium]